jgi:hypothetical protein
VTPPNTTRTSHEITRLHGRAHNRAVHEVGLVHGDDIDEAIEIANNVAT